MRSHPQIPLGFALALGAALFAVVPTAYAAPAAAKPSKPKSSVNATPAPAAGQFLPDTFVICRVGPRTTRVGKFVSSYFESYAEFRPAPDSAGRVEFLKNMVNKDVLGLVAQEVGRPLDFEDRAQLRETEQRALSNALYRSAVLDSLNLTEADIQREYESFRYDARLRHIVVPDSIAAQRIRLDLVRGKITWKQAYDRYSTSKQKDAGPDGDIGWKARIAFTVTDAHRIFSLGPGGISEPIQDGPDWNLIQVTETRPATPPSMEAVRPVLTDQLNGERMTRRSEAIRLMVRQEAGMVYDTTAIAWAASHFEPTRSVNNEGKGTELEFNTSVPEFTPQDTARVLARYHGGVMTLGRFMHLYTDIQPLMRPSIETPEAFKNQIDGFALEANLADVARKRGLDRDSIVVATVANKREQIMVEHLYADSIESRITVDPKARRKYYQDHLSGFITWARIHYAALWAENKGEADSLKARLKAGEKAADILRADSLLGINRGSIQERLENEHGPYQKLLFEMMRPGQVELDGPDKKGNYVVLQVLDYIPGRQLSYDEASGMIDESLQNVESERLLNEFIARHKKKYPVEARADLVMRIKLVDPTL